MSRISVSESRQRQERLHPCAGATSVPNHRAGTPLLSGDGDTSGSCAARHVAVNSPPLDSNAVIRHAFARFHQPSACYCLTCLEAAQGRRWYFRRLTPHDQQLADSPPGHFVSCSFPGRSTPPVPSHRVTSVNPNFIFSARSRHACLGLGRLMRAARLFHRVLS